MDNLEQLHYTFEEIISTRDGDINSCSVACALTCFVSGNNSLHIYDENKSEDRGIIYKVTEVKGCLQYVTYLVVYNVIILATENELLALDRTTFKTYAYHITSKTILALAWNPSETAFVVVDTDYRVFLYTTGSCSCRMGIPKYSIPWTQAKKKREAAEKDGVQKGTYNDPPNISWRSNCEQFVINFHKEGNRFIKVFSSNLEPLNISEEYFNLGPPVSFMGEGQRIACCAIRNNVNELVIFEKNCKVKAVFPIPHTCGEIVKLLYHPQMNMLALLSSDKQNNYINIYLYTNSKFFLKQQIVYPISLKIHDFFWLNLNEMLWTTCKLVVLTSERIEYRTFRFIISRCPSASITAVIDGPQVDYYMLDFKIVPPPIYLYSFKHFRPINHILFHPVKQYCVLLDSRLLVIIVDIDPSTGTIQKIMSLNPEFNDVYNFLYINWSLENEISIIIERYNDEEFQVKKKEAIDLQLTTVKRISRDLVLSYNDTNALVSHKVLDNDQHGLMYLTKIIFTKDLIEHDIDLALSNYHKFYFDGKLICEGVTSFFIFQKYLIFTHLNSKLYCIRLNNFNVFDNMLDLSKVFSREIEQGARILGCNKMLPPQIILQLPRGNLETIRCKLITIDMIETMLAKNEWEPAINMLRTEKVNWNVLIDLNPSRFLEHCEHFVRSAKNITKLTNIVTDFDLEENCFDTFYKNYLPPSAIHIKYSKTTIVKNILEYLLTTDCINNLGTIVLIQQKHISLKAALKSIQDVYTLNPEKNDSVCSKAIQLLLQQDNFKAVLGVAYSFYSLAFLAFVYRNGSEDPKVYEPELENFKNMDPVVQRFHMNVRGHDFKNAVRYLLRSKDFSEQFIAEFIVQNKLEHSAYSTVKCFNNNYKLVTRLFAKHLNLQHKYVEGGLILKKAGLLEEALVQYKKALEWREVISLMAQMKMETEKQVCILGELAEDLLKESRIDEAVILLEVFIRNYKNAIKILIEHKCYRQAICLAHIYNATDQIKEHIMPDLLNYMRILMEKINCNATKFENYVDRLQVVRQERILKQANSALGIYDGDDELFSETGSTISSLGSSKATSRSRGSSMSSKNRRKEERKKTDLRHGGFYEDIALIKALHILYTEVICLGNDIREICLVAEHENLEHCKALQQELNCLQKKMKLNIKEIWPETFVKDCPGTDLAALAINQNRNDLDPKYCFPPSEDISKPWQLEILS